MICTFYQFEESTVRCVFDFRQSLDASYWKVNGRWTPIGVIESYMNPNFELNKGMTAFYVLLERVGLILKTQSDTERVVKTIRKVEGRFANYNEAKESKGKRDCANQKIFFMKIMLDLVNFLWRI